MKTLTIKPIAKNLTWLEAREAVKERGGLPSNVLHDDYLVMSERYKELPSSYYWAWAKEVLIYPEENGVFEKGKDIIDSLTDNQGKSWIFPAKNIPKEAIGKKGIALFVDPKNVIVTSERVTIVPRKIKMIKNFPQKNGWYSYDKDTRIPIEGKYGNDFKDKRYLYRGSGVSVRPLARYDYGFDVDRRFVGAVGWLDGHLGVGFVEGLQKKFDTKEKICPTCNQRIR